MAQQLQSKLQTSVNAMIEELETSKLRPLRKQAFLDMAKCCETSSSRPAYQACVQRAAAPEERGEQVVQQELAEFQDRLQRAAMACQDQVKDSGLKDDKAAAAMDKCLVGVFERHIKLLAPLKKRVVEKI